MTADLSERDRIRAAMDRILDGTPERSNGALTVPRHARQRRHRRPVPRTGTGPAPRLTAGQEVSQCPSLLDTADTIELLEFLSGWLGSDRANFIACPALPGVSWEGGRVPGSPGRSRRPR
jgi:hypothetical protein